MTSVSYKLLPLFALTAALLSLAGCGSSNSQPSNNQFLTTDDSNAMQVATSGSVTCNGACSDSVGMLTSISQTQQVQECSGFLIAPDIMATNSHCIPEDLRTPGASCTDRLWAYFPSTNSYPSTQIRCSQILTASVIKEDGNSVGQDYAFFRLESSPSRPALIVSRNGFKDGETYNLVKVDPTTDVAAIGSMISVPCLAKHNSAMVPNSNNDASPNMEMADCTVVHGNSGSPILDSNGQVRGVIQAVFNNDALTLQFGLKNIPLLESLALLNLGTNYSCLPLPPGVTTSSTFPASCASLNNSAQSDKAREAALDAKITQDLNQNLQVFNPDAEFQWTFIEYKGGAGDISAYSSSSTQKKVVAVPKCISNLNNFLSQHNSRKTNETLNLEPPMVTVKLGLDRYLVLSDQLDTSSYPASMIVAFSPKDLSKQQKGTFTFNIKSYYDVTGMPYTATLSDCSAPKTNDAPTLAQDAPLSESEL